MTQYIDGRKIAEDIHDAIKDQIEHEKLNLGLAAILVGDDEASKIYINLKERAATRDGIRFEKFELPKDTAQGEILSLIEDLNRRDDIHAILVQLPLPEHVDTEQVILSIDPNKDVDGFHPVNIENYIAGESAVPPVLTQAIVSMIMSTNQKLDGMNALVVANSPALFAPPIAHALTPMNVTTDWTKIDAPGYKELLKSANIVVVAVGSPWAITQNMIKDNAILIDIGTTKINGKIKGDVNPNVDNRASWRSKVPGGVGPVTVATLMKNVLTCYYKQENRL